MKQPREYSAIISKIKRGIKREQQKNEFKYIEDPSKNYIRWTVEQLLVLIFAVFWALFSIAEFFFGITDKSEPLLSEAFHSFFHSLGSFLCLFCLCKTYNAERNSTENNKDHWYPYGKRKLNILAGFINGLNTMFSAFFVLVKQSHFLLDQDHHSHEENKEISRAQIYINFSIYLKSTLAVLMLLRLRRYLPYVTSRRSKYNNIKDFYQMQLKKWRSKYDNLHSFCLILLHQMVEKVIVIILNLLGFYNGSIARDTLITILISLFTCWISFPLCANTFINLVQGLSGPHTELIDLLKLEFSQKSNGQAKIIDSQFWALDMSYLIGSIKLKAFEQSIENKMNPQEAQGDWAGELRKIFGPYIQELTIEVIIDPQRSPKNTNTN